MLGYIELLSKSSKGGEEEGEDVLGEGGKIERIQTKGRSESRNNECGDYDWQRKRASQHFEVETFGYTVYIEDWVNKVMSIVGGFKLFYHDVDARRNGVGVIRKEGYNKSVLKVRRGKY